MQTERLPRPAPRSGAMPAPQAPTPCSVSRQPLADARHRVNTITSGVLSSSDALRLQARARRARKEDNARKRRQARLLSHTQRAAAALQRKNRTQTMEDDLKSIWEHEDEQIRDFAKKHKLSIAKASRKVRRLGNLPQTRDVNCWNAYLHFQSLNLQEDDSAFPVDLLRCS